MPTLGWACKVLTKKSTIKKGVIFRIELIFCKNNLNQAVPKS